MSALRVLLANAVDYAGLFPPAALAMPEAIRNYAAYRESEHAWALGRFVVTLSRFGEVADRPWRFSILAKPGESVPGDVAEFRVSKASEIVVQPGVTAYFEAPAELIPAIAAAGGRAKIRMGGDAVPDSPYVARFIVSCAKAGIAFKATAGLHHPIRTSEMHGFLNVLFAACLIRNGAEESDAITVLEERNPETFRLGMGLTVDQIADARENFIAGFGSCSFEEPLQDLRDLGLL